MVVLAGTPAALATPLHRGGRLPRWMESRRRRAGDRRPKPHPRPAAFAKALPAGGRVLTARILYHSRAREELFGEGESFRRRRCPEVAHQRSFQPPGRQPRSASTNRLLST